MWKRNKGVSTAEIYECVDVCVCVCLKLSKNKLIIKSKQIEVTSASSVFVLFVLTQTWKDEYLYLFLAEEIIIRAAFKKKNE